MKKENKWYDNANIVTNLIICIIGLIIIFSQSFALNNKSSLILFTSIINHNSVYFCVLVYFVLLKLPAGKKYFNYLSVFLIFIYFIITMTSLLTLIQSFNLTSTLSFILYSLLLIYLVHTLLRDTRVWREFYIGSSPFNELSNDFMFYSITAVSVVLLAVNLIDTTVVSSIIMLILDTIFVVLLSRYLYLYRSYLDKRKLDAENTGAFSVVKEKVQEVLDKTDIDEKIIDTSKKVKKHVKDTSKKIEKDINKFVKDNKIEEKISDTAKKVKKETKKTAKKIEKDIDSFVKEKKVSKKGDK